MARKKQPRRLTDLDIEVVIWNDPHSETRAVVTDELATCVSVGFLLRESEKTIVLGHELDDPDKDTFDSSDVDFTVIAKSLILSRHKIGRVPEAEEPA